jgi:RNA polymerase sigma factor (sigma-70 family)
VVHRTTRSIPTSPHVLETMPPPPHGDHKREHTLLVAYLRYRGFRPHIADEAASNAISEAWRMQVVGERRIGWLFTVAKRIASRETKHDPAARLAEKQYRSPAEQSDGTESFAAAEVAIDLRSAMRELNEREQQVMTLSLDGRSTPQISANLGLAPRTVNRAVDSARKKLRMLLGVKENEGGSR